MASEHSAQVTKAHVPGKWCKERNQCSRCCELRHWIRVLKHYAGTCSPKKCPVCEWARHTDQEYMVKVQEKALWRVQRRVYGLMLGIYHMW